jgi:WhiB family redox-sensing transcriptional regulator
MNQPMHPPEQPPPCAADPERWLRCTDTKHPDIKALLLCRYECPIRKQCAHDAWTTPTAHGIWAGVIIPEGRSGGQLRIRAFKRIAEIAGITITNSHQHRDDMQRRYPSVPKELV